jgi:hypothetical protein
MRMMVTYPPQKGIRRVLKKALFALQSDYVERSLFRKVFQNQRPPFRLPDSLRIQPQHRTRRHLVAGSESTRSAAHALREGVLNGLGRSTRHRQCQGSAVIFSCSCSGRAHRQMT